MCVGMDVTREVAEDDAAVLREHSDAHLVWARGAGSIGYAL